MASLPPAFGRGDFHDVDVDMGSDNIDPNYDLGRFDNQPPPRELRTTRPARRRLIQRGSSRTESDEYSRETDMSHDNPRPQTYHRLSKKQRGSTDDYDRDRASNSVGAVKDVVVKASDPQRGNPYDDRLPRHGQSAGHSGSRHHAHEVSRPSPKLEPSRNLECSLEEANTKNRELLEQLTNLKDTCQQLKQRNDAMQTVRDSQEELFGRQEPDSVISTQFHAVLGQVKSWSNKFCCEAARPLDVSSAGEDQLPLISRVMPSVQSFDDLQKELPPGDVRRRRKFVRGWIALSVAETMFRTLPAPGYRNDTGSDVWISSGPREAIETLELALMQSGNTITRRAFHEWRALTLGLFDKMCSTTRWPAETGPSIKDKVHHTLNLINSLAPPESDLAELENRLFYNVFIPAVELSQVLRRQRACWYVRFPHIMTGNALAQDSYVKPCMFNPDFMKDNDSSGGDDEGPSPDQCLKTVDIVLTPGLFKSGNHDGEQYDIEFPVEKAEVSCHEMQSLGSTTVPAASRIEICQRWAIPLSITSAFGRDAGTSVQE